MTHTELLTRRQTMATARKPLKVGLDYVRDPSWEPKLFTRVGAERFMARRASALQRETGKGLRWQGFVSDCADYWRGNVGGTF